MSPVRSAYAGGYSEGIKRQLERVVIPDKIKCENCKKIRMQSAFSKRQLDILRNAMVIEGAKAVTGRGHAKCRTCVGGQTVELRCCICDQIRGLEKFAKAQRQNRDRARCLDCVQDHTETEPVVEENKLLEEEEPSTAQESTMATSQIDDGSTIGNYGRRPRYSRGGSSYDADDDDDESIGGGVWVEPERHDENINTSKGKARAFTGFDAQGIPHRRTTSVAQSEARSVHTGWESWGVTPGNTISGLSKKPQSPLPKKKESKFAKVPAVKRTEKREIPVLRAPEPAGDVVPSDDDDEDSIEEYL